MEIFKIKLYCFFLLFTLIGSAQNLNKKANNSNIIAQDSVSFSNKNYNTFLGVDLYSNYFFEKENALIKTDGNHFWEYANLELGNITNISILNPLQILVFYKGSNTFVLLDRFLSETRRIDLNNLPEPKVAEWAVNTKNQEVWIYNSLNNQLEFFNYQNANNIATTIPLNAIPSSLCANFNNAYILTEGTLICYNNYGNAIHKIAIDNIEEIAIQGNNLIGYNTSEVILFDEKLKPYFNLKKQKNWSGDFFVGNEILYIYRDSTIYKYQLKLPTK